MAMFRAQLHEEEAVQVLIDMYRDPETAPGLRRQCALDVVSIARGPMAPWAHNGATIVEDGINPNTGLKIADEIDAQRRLSELHQQLDELVRQNVPADKWPEDVRVMAGDLIGYLDIEIETEDAQ